MHLMTSARSLVAITVSVSAIACAPLEPSQNVKDLTWTPAPQLQPLPKMVWTEALKPLNGEQQVFFRQSQSPNGDTYLSGFSPRRDDTGKIVSWGGILLRSTPLGQVSFTTSLRPIVWSASQAGYPRVYYAVNNAVLASEEGSNGVTRLVVPNATALTRVRYVHATEDRRVIAVYINREPVADGSLRVGKTRYAIWSETSGQWSDPVEVEQCPYTGNPWHIPAAAFHGESFLLVECRGGAVVRRPGMPLEVISQARLNGFAGQAAFSADGTKFALFSSRGDGAAGVVSVFRTSDLSLLGELTVGPGYFVKAGVVSSEVFVVQTVEFPAVRHNLYIVEPFQGSVTAIQAPDRESGLHAVFAVTSERWLALFHAPRGEAIFLETADRGKSWHPAPLH